jgi:AraC-like DNA-binding protein
LELSTIGRNFYPNIHHLMCYISEDNINENKGLHSRYRLILLQEGTGIVHINDHAYPIVAPAVFCMNEQKPLQFFMDSEHQFKCIYFHPNLINYRFSLESLHEPLELTFTDKQDLWCLEPFINRNNDYNGYIPLDPMTLKYAEYIYDEIDKVLALQADSHWPCRSRSFLMELLFLFRRSYRTDAIHLNKIPSVFSDPIYPAIQYLHTNYRSKITTDELTKLFNTNKTSLNQRFRAHTGMSTISYLNSIRMQVARSILRNTLLPTSEIMVRVGFNDDAHFIRNYKKYSGYSPAEYRKQFGWM